MRAPAMTTTCAIFVAMVPGSAADGGCSHKASAIDSISRTQLVTMLELPGKWCFTTPRMLKMEFVVCDFLCARVLGSSTSPVIASGKIDAMDR
jgi:hypothetical protein